MIYVISLERLFICGSWPLKQPKHLCRVRAPTPTTSAPPPRTLTISTPPLPLFLLLVVEKQTIFWSTMICVERAGEPLLSQNH